MNHQRETAATPPPIPVRLERYQHEPPPRRKFWLHPKSGLLILAVDWFFFGTEIITLELAVVIASFFAFMITTAGVFWIQRRFNGDSVSAAFGKALFGGIIAGLPTSIGGTILGAVVLALSGLSGWNQRRGAR